MRAFTEPFPFRQSTALQGYSEFYNLPIVYGRTRLQPKPYDNSGRLWLLSDGVIQGVDSVSVDGSIINDWELQKGVDSTGAPVSVLETAIDGTPVVTLRGKETDGQLLQRPDQIITDLFALVGRTIDLDELRTWSQDSGILCAGVINNSATIQTVIDSVVQGMGLAWNQDNVIPYPEITAHSVAQITVKNDNFNAASQAANITTRLTVNYRYDYAAQRPSRSFVMDATETDYGIRETTVNANWITDNKSAEALGDRYLRWFASPVWEIQSSLVAEVAQVVDINHPYSPVTKALVTKRNNNGVTAVASSIYAGKLNIISRTSGEDIESTTSTELTTTPDGFIYNVTDSNDRVLAGASVTLDGSVTRITDGSGNVQFSASKGKHKLVIRASGFQDQTVEITV